MTESWAGPGNEAIYTQIHTSMGVYLVVKMDVYMFGTCIFRIYILPYLCEMQYFHIALHVDSTTVAQGTRLASSPGLFEISVYRSREIVQRYVK